MDKLNIIWAKPNDQAKLIHDSQHIWIHSKGTKTFFGFDFLNGLKINILAS